MRPRHAAALAGPFAALLVAAAAGCASSPGSKGCSVDADCEAGARCEAGTCQLHLVVALASPAQPVSTNSSAPVPVKVTVEGGGGSSVAVAIRVDDLVLATIGPPYEYAWDTSTTAEGAHALWARVTAGSKDYDSARVQVTVDRTAPAAPVILDPGPSNVSPVQVRGTAEPLSGVAILLDGSPVSAATAGPDGTWTAAPGLTVNPGEERTFRFTATATDAAGNASAASAPVDQRVDRLPPAVTATVPLDGAPSVAFRDPVTATFGEAILGRTVTADSVRVSWASGPLSLPFALSGDGRRLTVSPPASLPDGAGQLTALLSGLTDLAGNALPATTWTWSLPQWLPVAPARQLTGSDNSPTFRWALTPSGDAVLAYQTRLSCARKILAASGGAWTDVGAAGSGFGHGGYPCVGGATSVAVDGAGRIVVAYVENDLTSSTGMLYVDRRDAAGWTHLGGALNHDASRSASSPIVRIDETDAPIVLFAEPYTVGTSTYRHLAAQRWNGASWDEILSETPTSASDVTAAALAVASSSRISAAYVVGGNVKLVRVAGTAAVGVPAGALGGGAVGDVALALDGSGLEVVAYLEGGAVTVARPRAGELFPTWQSIGGPFGTAAFGPSLAFRPSAPAGRQLALGYVDSGPRVQAFDGSSWTSIAESIGLPASPVGNYGAGLATTPGGRLGFAWAEERSVVTVVTESYNR